MTIHRLPLAFILAVVVSLPTPAAARAPRGRTISGIVQKTSEPTREAEIVRIDTGASLSFVWISRTIFVAYLQVVDAAILKPGAKVEVIYHQPFFGRPFATKVTLLSAPDPHTNMSQKPQMLNLRENKLDELSSYVEATREVKWAVEYALEKEAWIPVIAQSELAFYRYRDPDSVGRQSRRPAASWLRRASSSHEIGEIQKKGDFEMKRIAQPLKRRIALITGASSGIGEAVALSSTFAATTCWQKSLSTPADANPEEKSGGCCE